MKDPDIIETPAEAFLRAEIDRLTEALAEVQEERDHLKRWQEVAMRTGLQTQIALCAPVTVEEVQYQSALTCPLLKKAEEVAERIAFEAWAHQYTPTPPLWAWDAWKTRAALHASRCALLQTPKGTP